MANRHNINTTLERSPVGMGLRKLSQIVTLADFTDGGQASGLVDLSQKLPAGAFVIGSRVKVVEAFAGNTSAALEIGREGDVDAFADGINVFTTGDKGEAAYDQTEQFRAAETTVRLTVTAATDFGAITGGRMRIDLYYHSTEPELQNDTIDRYDE